MNYETKTNEIRQMVIDMLYRCQSGHPGGSLSEVEILTALYYNVMKVRYSKGSSVSSRYS